MTLKKFLNTLWAFIMLALLVVPMILALLGIDL
jgi:hypothetical protein